MLRRSILAGRRRPVVQAATGAGKTVLAAAIVEGALRKGNRVCFCVPALSLIDQTVHAFWREGITDVGVIQADHAMTDWSKPVQVASIQTITRRGYPEADVVVIDECHVLHDAHKRWMADGAFAKVPFIGLSATPWTKGLGKRFDDLVIAATTRDLIEQGYLSPFRVFAPSHPDLSDVKIVAGDYHEGQLSKVMSKAPIVADVVTTWLEKAEGRPTLVFAVDRAHAATLQERFVEAGVPAAYQDANTDSLEREGIRRSFHEGRIKVVCSVGTLTTGVDWDVRCIVLARPTRSEMLYVQIIGRGLRTAPGKQECVILDHSDTTLRLGFVTDIYHDALDDGKGRGQKADAKSKEALPKECSECGYLKPAKVRACPNCGHEPKRPDTVEVQDGELQEITPGAKKKGKGAKREMTSEEKAAFYGELLWIAGERGYSSGWAAHKFREKAGVWPNHYKDAPPQPPTPATVSWVRSRQIAWAKSRKREQEGATSAAR